MTNFKYELEQDVRIKISGETGKVMGRAEYTEKDDPMYMLHYVNGQGNAIEGWFQEKFIEAVVQDDEPLA